MKNRRIAALLLVILALLTLFPAEGFASSYKVENLQFGKWYTLKDSSNTMTIYRLKVTADTVVLVNWKNYNEDDGFGYGSIYYDKNCDNDIGYSCYFLDGESGSKGYVLYKGTYYIRMYDSSGKAKVKITSKSVKSINKQNYCLENAITLKANKKVELAQTKKNNYQRWYRIKLTKDQVITIKGLEYYGNYELYDSNFNDIRVVKTDGGIKTDGIQNKGTYYLVMHDYISSLLKTGNYYKIYWY